MILFSVLLLLVPGPVTSFAATQTPVENSRLKDSNHSEDQAEFEIDGVTYTLTLHKDGNYQEAVISDGKTEETVSYDSSKDELKFGDELVSDEDIELMKESVANSTVEDNSTNLDGKLQMMAVSQNIPYRLVKTYKNAINVPVATALVVTGLILILPTGTGAVAGAVLTAKIIAVLVTAIVSSLKDTGNKYVYFTFKTYYKGQGGYWWNKFVLSAYKDSNRTKLIKSVSHETKYGKKYSYDYLEEKNSPLVSLYA